MSLQGKRVLLVIGGGIAAYKTLELIRQLQERGAGVRAILTDAGAQFVTPLSVASLTADRVYQNLFDLTQESEMGHIVLSRSADLVVVAPATADLIAKMAAGIANDLATTALLATDKRVLIAPAMNVFMWEHAATKRNIETLKADGIAVVGPNAGALAESKQATLGQVLTRATTLPSEGMIVFKSVGMALQDLALAARYYELLGGREDLASPSNVASLRSRNPPVVV